jgi:DNA-binding NarL/FixJ family response regulator
MAKSLVLESESHPPKNVFNSIEGRTAGSSGRQRRRSYLILIADEQAVVRKCLRTLLESQPSFKVVAEANNGSEAVAKAGQFGPDLVILNIGLPELSGIDAARLILKKAPQTRVLFFTNDDRQETATMAHRAGALGHVLISDPERDLIGVVHAVLNTRGFISSGAAEWCVTALGNRQNQRATRL